MKHEVGKCNPEILRCNPANCAASHSVQLCAAPRPASPRPAPPRPTAPFRLDAFAGVRPSCGVRSERSCCAAVAEAPLIRFRPAAATLALRSLMTSVLKKPFFLNALEKNEKNLFFSEKLCFFFGKIGKIGRVHG